jgi:anti-sigma factor RsiW
MPHADAATCADFVRGVLPPARQSALTRHLATCRDCSGTVEWLRAVNAIAVADGAYEPPPHVLRRARALFALERPRLIRRLPRLVGKLMFDSLMQPALAGVRGPAGASRQAVFEAGDYAVDITVDQAPGSRRTMLVGQVMSRLAPNAPITAAPVLLTSGEHVVARTVCDRFGEFLLEYDTPRRLQLHVVVDAGKRRLELPLEADTVVTRRTAGERRRPARRGRKRPGGGGGRG